MNAAEITDLSGRRWPAPGSPSAGALLVVDVQRSFADPSLLPWLDEAGQKAVDAAVARTGWLVERARDAGVRVVWVVLEQRPDAAWDSSRWLRRVPLELPWPQGDEPCLRGTAGSELFRLKAMPGELVSPKTRYSGFFGTDLDQRLRAVGVSWVTVCGLTTECCVDSTARDAFQHGFRVVVASDACAAYEEEMHRHTLATLAVNVAIVTTAEAVAHCWVRMVPLPEKSSTVVDPS